MIREADWKWNFACLEIRSVGDTIAEGVDEVNTKRVAARQRAGRNGKFDRVGAVEAISLGAVAAAEVSPADALAGR